MTYAKASFSFESICTQSGMVACDKHDIGSTPTKIKNKTKQNKTRQYYKTEQANKKTQLLT
jgi:hypothetical protein